MLLLKHLLPSVQFFSAVIFESDILLNVIVTGFLGHFFLVLSFYFHHVIYAEATNFDCVFIDNI